MKGFKLGKKFLRIALGISVVVLIVVLALGLSFLFKKESPKKTEKPTITTQAQTPAQTVNLSTTQPPVVKKVAEPKKAVEKVKESEVVKLTSEVKRLTEAVDKLKAEIAETQKQPAPQAQIPAQTEQKEEYYEPREMMVRYPQLCLLVGWNWVDFYLGLGVPWWPRWYGYPYWYDIYYPLYPNWPWEFYWAYSPYRFHHYYSGYYGYDDPAGNRRIQTVSKKQLSKTYPSRFNSSRKTTSVSNVRFESPWGNLNSLKKSSASSTHFYSFRSSSRPYSIQSSTRSAPSRLSSRPQSAPSRSSGSIRKK